MSQTMEATTSPKANSTRLGALDNFARRHIGPSDDEALDMARAVGFDSVDALVDRAVPESIRIAGLEELPDAITESETLADLQRFADRNRRFKSYLGLGYHGTITPPVILRNILENPGWYTQYTPYQAEISQGRMEALLNFQTMVADLTGLPIANASLLDEGTAAAEAVSMAYGAVGGRGRDTVLISDRCHPQTIEVVQARAEAVGIASQVVDLSANPDLSEAFAVVLQYPDTDGVARDFSSLCSKAAASKTLTIACCDLLALALLTPPGDWGADIAVGSAQRFGVPMGFGGPHAAFFATTEKYKRKIPGRLIGVSKDADGQPALRLSLQTREQHIRRDKATSNICTAQVLLANIAAAYATYHGPDGLRAIAERVRRLALVAARYIESQGDSVLSGERFDTLRIATERSDTILQRAEAAQINLRRYSNGDLGVSFDETVSEADLLKLLALFKSSADPELNSLLAEIDESIPKPFDRQSDYLAHPVFNRYHTETEMLRYLKRLENKDLSLTTSMIPLGSCTMKLNATTEMIPVTWPEFAELHPLAPKSQTEGYLALIEELESWLAHITGFAGVSIQPNAGSQGEYAGLLIIRKYHEARGDAERNVCIIPLSAHGTNPASAVMAGLKVVPVKCDELGNIDLEDLREKSQTHAEKLAALMVTYPSTHGVFEESIREICDVIHQHGGQVYMDGANMNAQCGLTSPGAIGADVCHLNLHKTFCIPHGGGGPGVGPVGVAEHLVDFLPGHGLNADIGGSQAIKAISAAPYGSASILPISWAYIRMMGAVGLTKASKAAILNANYMAKRLEDHYPIVYRGAKGLVAHEFIIDFREWKDKAGIEVEDVAKRLMDYGFHAPTMSWPVPGTMMIEPTESESKAELDRLCDALIQIKREMQRIADGEWPADDNPLKNAPHSSQRIVSENWSSPYSRDLAAFPAKWSREYKYWPAVSRVDNVYGDRNLVCSCPPMEEYGD